ncbi:hypothetical protein BH23ACT10_BH23ACT10_08840 [soil metagenome]
MTSQLAASGSADAARDVEIATIAPEALGTYLRDRLEDHVVDQLVAYGQLTVTVAAAAVPTAVQLCRDDPRLGFDFFDFLTAVDEREDGFAVIIHLYSTRHRHHVQIRALAEGGRDEPHLPTISHLYGGANWHERETYDMFGITFDGHPGLLPRILTVENFEGFPLRKEFLLMSREVKPWPGLKEPKEVDKGDADGEGGDDTASGKPADGEDKAKMARERAERAKAKAAEARKLKARERGERSEPAGGDSGQPAEAADEPTQAADEPADADDDVSDEKQAAVAEGSGDDEVAGDPEQAAEVSDDAVAKDAAAGAVAGDTSEEASAESSEHDQPTADDTPDDEGSLASDEIDETFQGDDGGQGLPPRGPGDEEPRALAGDGVDPVPLVEEHDTTIGDPVADRPELDRPMGTDADDRIRRLEQERDDDDAFASPRPAPSGPPVEPLDDAAMDDQAAPDTDAEEPVGAEPDSTGDDDAGEAADTDDTDADDAGEPTDDESDAAVDDEPDAAVDDAADDTDADDGEADAEGQRT